MALNLCGFVVLFPFLENRFLPLYNIIYFVLIFVLSSLHFSLSCMLILFLSSFILSTFASSVSCSMSSCNDSSKTNCIYLCKNEKIEIKYSIFLFGYFPDIIFSGVPSQEKKVLYFAIQNL